MGDKNGAPAPPDYGPLIAASKEASERSFQLGREQLAWAKEAYAHDKTITDQTSAKFLEAMDFSMANASKDRARYESVYQPIEDDFVQNAKNFDTQERRDQEAARGMAEVGTQFEAARSNAERELESYGINPSATRFAALDIGVRAQEAAAKAAAADMGRRYVETTGNQMKAQAIDIGRGYPGQVANSSNVGNASGGAGVQSTLAGTASGASTMGTAPQYNGMGINALGNWGSVLNNQYQGQLAQYKANQDSSTGFGSMLGVAAGVGLRLAGFEEGGAVPAHLSPSGGASADDVPAAVSVGEYIVPADAVRWIGEKNIQKLVEKARTEKQGVPMDRRDVPYKAGSGGSSKDGGRPHTQAPSGALPIPPARPAPQRAIPYV